MKSTTGAINEHSFVWKLHITRQSISVRVRNAKKRLAFPKRVFLASAEPTGVMKCKRTDVKKKKKEKKNNKPLMFQNVFCAPPDKD